MPKRIHASVLVTRRCFFDIVTVQAALQSLTSSRQLEGKEMGDLIIKSLVDAFRLGFWLIGGIVKLVMIVIYHLRQPSGG